MIEHDLFRQFIESYYLSTHEYVQQYSPELIMYLIAEVYDTDCVIGHSKISRIFYRLATLQDSSGGFALWARATLERFKDYIHNTKYIVDRDLVNIIQI
jgi:hypothetical protein